MHDGLSRGSVMFARLTRLRIVFLGLAAVMLSTLLVSCEPGPGASGHACHDDPGRVERQRGLQFAGGRAGGEHRQGGQRLSGWGRSRCDRGAGWHVPAHQGGVHEQQNLAGDLDIRSVLTIRGAGRASTFLDGARLDRTLDVFGGASATVQDLALRNGLAPAGRRGGAVAVLENGTLNLTRVDVTANATQTGNGGANDNHVEQYGGTGFLRVPSFSLVCSTWFMSGAPPLPVCVALAVTSTRVRFNVPFSSTMTLPAATAGGRKAIAQGEVLHGRRRAPEDVERSVESRPVQEGARPPGAPDRKRTPDGEIAGEVLLLVNPRLW